MGILQFNLLRISSGIIKKEYRGKVIMIIIFLK